MASRKGVIIAFLCVVALVGTIALAIPNVTPIYLACGLPDNATTPFQLMSYAGTRHLAFTTCRRAFNYYIEIDFLGSYFYGHATCAAKLSDQDCIMCLAIANAGRLVACEFSRGAQVTLIDCHMRFEEYDFIYHTKMKLDYSELRASGRR